MGELDFLFKRADGSIIAIEVKSGSNYITHAALDNALAVRDYHIDEAIVLAYDAGLMSVTFGLYRKNLLDE